MLTYDTHQYLSIRVRINRPLNCRNDGWRKRSKLHLEALTRIFEHSGQNGKYFR